MAPSEEEPKGFVYILEVKDLALPICKIGMTTRTPAERCSEINKSSTGDLLWSVSSHVAVNDCAMLESLVHKELGDFRQIGREFFNLNPVDAYQRIQGIMASSQIKEIICNEVQAARKSKKNPVYRKTNLVYAEIFQLFASLLGIKGRPFGQLSEPVFGISDGHTGVQRNIAVFIKKGQVQIGVNLEGMKYSNWPIAKLLLAEKAKPSFESLRPFQDQVLIRMTRDAWQCAARPEIEERYIGGSDDIPISEISRERWASMVDEALGCLDAENKYLGRGKQWVTRLKSKERCFMEVSPHLTFCTSIGKYGQDIEAGVARLEPFYDWVSKRSCHP